MKKLSNTFVFRLLLTIVLCCVINKPIVYIAGFVLFLIIDYKTSFIYLILLIVILVTNSIMIDFINYGIVEKKINNYYVVDKLLYKEKIISNSLQIGDVVCTQSSKYIDDLTYQKKNIKYECDKYHVLFNIKIKNIVYGYVQSFDEQIKVPLNKFLYNINDYDDLNFNLGYGLAIYYLIKQISKKSNRIGQILMLLYILLFYFDIKFYLLIIDFIFSKQNSFVRLYIKILFILIVNINMLNNNSIILPLLISIYYKLHINISFKLYLSLIESYLFGYFNLLGIFIFKYIIYFQIILFILSLVILIFPNIRIIYLFLIKIYSMLNEIEIPIRGTFSLIGIVIYFLIIFITKIKNDNLKYLFMILVLLCPLNNPFMHISFIDVGQGDSTLIKLPLNMGNILIDTGSEYNYYKLSKYLFSEGIYKIDYLIITHNDNDHNGNLNSLKNDFFIRNIINSPEDISYHGLNLKNLYLGEYDNDNDNSLIYWCNINNIKFLFTGDISKNVERKLINVYTNLDVDILKVSHHGSKTGTSEELISNTLPKIATISTSSMYGHPAKETINILKDYQVDYLITKEVGNIEIYMTKFLNFLKTDNLEFAIIMCDDIHN